MQWNKTPFHIFQAPSKGDCAHFDDSKEVHSLDNDDMNEFLEEAGLFDLKRVKRVRKGEESADGDDDDEEEEGSESGDEEMDDDAKEEFATEVDEWLTDLTEEELLPMDELPASGTVVWTLKIKN